MGPSQPGVSGGFTKLPCPGLGLVGSELPAEPQETGLRWTPALAQVAPLGRELGPPQNQGAQNCPSSSNLTPPQPPPLSSERVGLGASSPETRAWGRCCPVSGYALPLLVTLGSAAPGGAPVVVGWTFQGNMRRVGREIRDPPARTTPIPAPSSASQIYWEFDAQS